MDNLQEPRVREISAKDVMSAMDSKKDIVLLDVRTPGEYARGKIDGSMNLPLDDVQCKVHEVIPDKDKTVYVYCLSGSRSIHAVDAMMRLGYTRVFNMTSGLLAWRVKGYSVIV